MELEVATLQIHPWILLLQLIWPYRLAWLDSNKMVSLSLKCCHPDSV